MKGNAVATRKYIIENEIEFNSDYANFIHNFYEYIIGLDELDYSLRAEWTIILAEYLWRMTIAIDEEICAAACIAEMTKKLNK